MDEDASPPFPATTLDPWLGLLRLRLLFRAPSSSPSWFCCTSMDVRSSSKPWMCDDSRP